MAKKKFYVNYVKLHRDIEKRQRDRKDRDEERWTEIGYRERKKKSATQKRHRDGYIDRKKERERNYRLNRERFIYFFFFFLNEMAKR